MVLDREHRRYPAHIIIVQDLEHIFNGLADHHFPEDRHCIAKRRPQTIYLLDKRLVFFPDFFNFFVKIQYRFFAQLR